MPRQGALVSLLIALAWAPRADASPPRDHVLVSTFRCLAGSWGARTQVEWRVQLGLFDARRVGAVDDYTRAARARHHGVGFELFTAAWLTEVPPYDADDHGEPLVGVSRVYRSRADAQAAVQRYRAAGYVSAFVRRYVRYVD